MTRAIKFRAWDGKKMWQYAVPLLSKAHNGGTINVSDNEDGSFNQFINGELTQFTGLHDKNGKEVYEGDIVSIMDCEPSLYKICYWEQVFKWGVKYLGEDLTNWQEENLEEFDSYCVEVVGNVFENPELLEVQP